jgi:hypothetical protein
MRGGLDDMLYFMLSCYVAIFIFISMLILGSQDNRKHKPFGGGDSNTFIKYELINKFEEYIKTYFDGINDIYKEETIKIFTEKINKYGDDINVEKLEDFKEKIVDKINDIIKNLIKKLNFT